jgi:hypothetical protein
MGDAAEAESEEGKEDVEVVIPDPAEWYTSEYGYDPPGEAWNAQDEQGAWEWIRRMSLEHPCVKQGNECMFDNRDWTLAFGFPRSTVAIPQRPAKSNTRRSLQRAQVLLLSRFYLP